MNIFRFIAPKKRLSIPRNKIRTFIGILFMTASCANLEPRIHINYFGETKSETKSDTHQIRQHYTLLL